MYCQTVNQSCWLCRDRRSGATLIEVLVAIFVMAIGLMSLLALFPVGAMSMAKAIREERSVNAAHNALAIANIKNIRNNPFLVGPGLDVYANPPGVAGANPKDPSYPVFVDPLGIAYGGSPWVGGFTGLIPRRSVDFVANINLARRWFTMLDDIQFEQDGTPKIFGGIFERESLYTYAYLCQRPKSGDHSVIDLTVVVYLQRPVINLAETIYGFGGPVDAVGNPLYQVSYDTTRNVIRVSVPAGSSLPSVKAGDWVLDATIRVNGVDVRHGYFYRVVGVTDINAPTPTTEMEVQAPLRGFGPPAVYSFMANVTYPTLMVLEGVQEVFEKGTIR